MDCVAEMQSPNWERFMCICNRRPWEIGSGEILI